MFGHQCLLEQQLEVRMPFSRVVGSLDQESDLNEKHKFTLFTGYKVMCKY